MVATRRGIGHYLRDHRRRTAENRTGSISEVLGVGLYRVILDATGGTLRASVSHPGDAFKVGQSVLLSNLGGSGATPNGGWVILGPSALQNRSDAAPYSTTREHTAETVSLIKSGGVDVSRVTLMAGGAAVTIQIYGNSLETAPTYGHAGITNDVAPVITTPLITIVVEASVAVPPGLYSLTVAGVERAEFFEVT